MLKNSVKLTQFVRGKTQVNEIINFQLVETVEL